MLLELASLCKLWPVEVSFVTWDEYCSEGHAICFAWFDSELYRTAVLIRGSCFTSLLSIIQNNPKNAMLGSWVKNKSSLPPSLHALHYCRKSLGFAKRQWNSLVLVVVSFLRKKDAAILQGTDIPVLIAHPFYSHMHTCTGVRLRAVCVTLECTMVRARVANKR